jgi:uncharacterized protein with PIN domain
MRKVRKILKRKCPECNAPLQLVTEIIKDADGISYSEDFEECQECDYKKLVINKHNRPTKFESDL